ncbi:MAG TPA: hypothetical protein VFS67_32565 [Polyangiaceae bacterium]|jgi:hypothetical protein|nr:hypothetical protein [Polyangiaceae bacterium]
MDLQKVLGFPLDKVRIDPDGTSTPPEVSPLSPPTQPRGRAAPDARLLEATRIEGLQAPPPPPPAAPAAAPAPTAAAPAPPVAAAPAAVAVAAAPAPAQPAPSLVSGPLATWRRRLGGARDRIRPPQGWGLIAISSALMGFGMTVLVAVLVRGSHPTPDGGSSSVRPRPSPSAALAAPVPAPSSREACARQREPELVARAVSSSFALETRAREGGVELLIGLSLGAGTALGLQLNATTLSATELVRDSGSRELLGVVPTPGAPPPSFAIDRASVGGFRDWRTLPERPGWGLARTNRALNLVERATRRAIPLWTMRADEELSRPRLERQDATRWALVLRRGGRQGKLQIGWFAPEGGEHGELRTLPFTGVELGLPSLATAGKLAAVAAATRTTNSAPWHLEITTSEPEGRTRRIDLQALEAGTEEERFAPSLAALPDSRWFLQWTEGQQGLRSVRGVTLDAQFAPIGDPISLSPAGDSAGGGNIVGVDEGLLALFLIQRGNSYELWATTLSCR